MNITLYYIILIQPLNLWETISICLLSKNVPEILNFFLYLCNIHEWTMYLFVFDCHNKFLHENSVFILLESESLFVLYKWTPSQRKEVGTLMGISPHVLEQNKRSYLPRPDQS